MSKERRLGRGLEALLGRAGIDTPPAVTQGTSAVAQQPARGTPPAGLGSGAARLMLHAPDEVEQAAATLPTSEVAPARIDPNPWQPRSIVDDADLAELAASLGEHGLVQPIVVRAQGDRYQLIAGQRRLAAAKRLGWEKVPVRVLDVDDRQMSEIAIVENLQRRDLDALEKAASFKQYLATWNCTQDELAKRLSVDRSTVANLIRLLELPAGVQQKLRAGGISMGHARALLPLGDEDQQVRLADRVAAEGLSVRAIESEVQEIIRREEADELGEDAGDEADNAALVTDEGAAGVPSAPKRKPGRPATRRSSQVAAVEGQLRRALGVKVVVHANGKGAGRIVIPFGDLDEFQRLLDHITD
ncbi:MAG: ParB/RepB/Spo0J family partition protein [Planctomycetia bacterium]|nr:ParB/RepB/Spo0J family partition protein [Planctomycetia bacterium]